MQALGSVLRRSLSDRADSLARSRRLLLSLFSAESSCLLASASAPWSTKTSSRAAAEAVDKLLGKLRGTLQMPSGAKTVATKKPGRVVEEEIGEAYEAWEEDGGGKLVLVRFQSDPAGAVVMVDEHWSRPSTMTTAPAGS